MARQLIVIVLTALLGLSAVAMAQAKREMTMQEYQTRLQACQQRKRVADSTRAVVERQTQDRRAEIASIDSQVVAVAKQVMEAVGARDSTAVRDSVRHADALVQRLQALRQLSANQIADARDAGELDRIQRELDALKGSPIAALPEIKAKIDAAERLLAELRTVQRPIPPVRRDQYTVVRGDYLWKIAKKPDTYADPYAWVRLYTANKDMIRDPNLIYPNWVIGVPRNQAPGTYWVERGDYLRKIAARPDVYGDPTQWTKLYRANRDVIEVLGGDEHTIYPHMILNVPKN